MAKLINPEDELQLPNLGLPRMHRKYMPDISREINMTEAVTLNPGTLSNFHKDCLTCIGNSFTGLQFAVNKFISSTSVKLKSKVRIRTAQVDGELITKYLTTKQTRFGEHSILIETITNFIPSWPSISISQAIDDFLYTSITYSAQDTPKSGLELEYYNRIGTLAFKCTGWPSGSGIICSTSYLRSITRKLALGAELTLRSSALPELNQRLSDITYYARYRGPVYTACLDFCKSSGYHFSYFRNINEYLAWAVDIIGPVNFKQVTGTIAIKKKVPKYELTITGHLANDGAITGILNKQFIGDFPISVTISGFYNFFVGECGFGIGLSA